MLDRACKSPTDPTNILLVDYMSRLDEIFGFNGERNIDSIPTDIYNPWPVPFVYASVLQCCARDEAPKAFPAQRHLDDHSIRSRLVVHRRPALVGSGGSEWVI